MEIDGCLVPDELRYDLELDVWARVEGDGREITIGVLGTLASFAGRFQAVTFRPVDDRIDRGRSVATVESTRYTGAVRSPVSGTIVARNPAITERPKLLNDATYGDGWVVRVRPDRPEEIYQHLRPATEIAATLAERIRTQGIRCFPAAPDVELVQVGAECAAVLAALDEEIARRAPGELVLLVTDDTTSPIEMVRWEDRSGHPVVHRRRDGTLFSFLVRKVPDPSPRRRAG